MQLDVEQLLNSQLCCTLHSETSQTVCLIWLNWLNFITNLEVLIALIKQRFSTRWVSINCAMLAHGHESFESCLRIWGGSEWGWLGWPSPQLGCSPYIYCFLTPICTRAAPQRCKLLEEMQMPLPALSAPITCHVLLLDVLFQFGQPLQVGLIPCNCIPRCLWEVSAAGFTLTWILDSVLCCQKLC